jgi:hypothetical protein
LRSWRPRLPASASWTAWARLRAADTVFGALPVAACCAPNPCTLAATPGLPRCTMLLPSTWQQEL